MLRVWVLILAISVLALHIRLSVQVLAFEINQDYIARVLCINQDKPEVHCGGSCHLDSLMDAHEEQKQETPQLSNETRIDLLSEGLPRLALKIHSMRAAPLFCPRSLGLTASWTESLFHPPTH